MYDYIWIPETIEEMVFIIKNNKQVFNDYFQKRASENDPRLLMFYYNKRSTCVEEYDYTSSIREGYIERRVRFYNDISTNKLVSVIKGMRYKTRVKY